MEQPIRLHDQRLDAVAEALKAGLPDAHRVIDRGCGEGKLLRLLVKESQWRGIVGMDVSTAALKIAARRQHLDRDGGAGSGLHDRLTLLHGHCCTATSGSPGSTPPLWWKCWSISSRSDWSSWSDLGGVHRLRQIRPGRLRLLERA